MRFMLNIILGHHPLFNTQRIFLEKPDNINYEHELSSYNIDKHN